MADVIATLGAVFLGTAPADCSDAADANDDGSVDLADGITCLNWLFVGGAEPSAPGPYECGSDPSDDTLDCEVAHVCD